MLTTILKSVSADGTAQTRLRECKTTTNYENAFVMLNDVGEHADKHEFPEALKPISRVRSVSDQDFDGTISLARKPEKPTNDRLVQLTSLDQIPSQTRVIVSASLLD